MQRDSQVDLFRLESCATTTPSTTTSSSSSCLDVTTSKSNASLARESSTQLGTIQVDSQSNLVASCISTDGNYLAVCDATSLLVFQLTVTQEPSEDGTRESVTPQKLELPAALVSCPYVALHFASATQLLAATTSGTIQVLNLDTMETCLLSPPAPPPPSSQSSANHGSLPIHSLHTSPNGAFLASLSHSQHDAIHVYAKDGISYKHVWNLPNLSARPSALTFLPSPNANQLAVATSTSAVYLFDLTTQKLAPWSEEQGFPLSQNTLPNELANRREYPLRLAVNPSDPNKLIMVRP
jgi:hypothetical protein